MEEIQVNDEENLAEFMEKERPIWPKIPALCTVPDCKDLGKFSSFKDVTFHWREIHIETQNYYKCLHCKKSFSNRKHMKRHKTFHKGLQADIIEVTKKNEKFINPGDCVQYRLGCKLERNYLMEFQRYKARDDRKKETERLNKLYEKPIEGFEHQVCRDERIVERNGQFYKDTNMWDSTQRRKRMKLSEPTYI